MRSQCSPLKVRSYGIQLRLIKGNGLGCVHPDAIYVPEDKYPFRLYYTPHPPNKAELPYLMVSTNGYNFVEDDIRNPLLTRGRKGEWDHSHLADVEVILYRGQWLMFYAGASYVDGRKIVSIGNAFSDDGFSWFKNPENPLLKPNPQYWWEQGTPARKALTGPAVIAVDDTLYLYYASLGPDGKYRIALAYLKNGNVFARLNVVLEPSFNWEKCGISHPDVVVFRDHILLTYVADSCEEKCLGLAIARLNDPLTFKKIPNPLLKPRRTLYKLFKRGRKIRRKILEHTLAKIAKYNMRLKHFWNTLHIYRSAFLTSGDHKLFLKNSNTALLYYSAYDEVFGLPSIGLTEVEVDYSCIKDLI